MTQEERDLLLRDLCSRKPYEVILHFEERLKQDDEYFYGIRENGGKDLINDAFYVEEVKPYLRSLSTMTEKELDEYRNLYYCVEREYNQGCAFYNEYLVIFGDEARMAMIIDWLNKHHFDYRGLIEKGLAIEAPEEMYV